MEYGPQQLGKWLILAGIILALTGALLLVLARFGPTGFFKLPGDLSFSWKAWHIYLPIATCAVLSILLTMVLWLINYLRR